jgi:REP element-mobilizing transposase RayT
MASWKGHFHIVTHLRQRISPLFGTMVDVSDEYENAFDSICANREFDSNTIE